MSDEQIQSPRFAQEDLLDKNFFNRDANQQNKTSSASLSFSDTFHADNRFSFGAAHHRRAIVNGRNMERLFELPQEQGKDVLKQESNQKVKSHTISQSYRVMDSLKTTNKSSKVESRLQPLSLPTVEHNSHHQIERPRRSSFFQIEDYSTFIQNLDSQHLYLPYQQVSSSKKQPFITEEQQEKITQSREIKHLNRKPLRLSSQSNYFSRNSSEDADKVMNQQFNKIFLLSEDPQFQPIEEGEEYILQNKKKQLGRKQHSEERKTEKFKREKERERERENEREKQKEREREREKQKKPNKLSTQTLARRLQQQNPQQPLNYPQQSNKFTNQKPICFNCGGSHYYDQCSLHVDLSSPSQIKCFNCKLSGHTARYCKEPKRCTNCESTLHLARNCPSLQSVNLKKICGNCYKPGHFAKECPQPKKCYLCHQVGHQIRNCPQNRQNRLPNDSLDIKLNSMRIKSCFNCQKPGHYANQCNQPERCHNCNQQGHYSRDCPHMMRSLSIRNNMNINAANNQKIRNEEQQKVQSRQKPQSESAVDSGSKKLDLGKFHFKKYMRETKRQTGSKSKRKTTSKREKSKAMSKRNKQRKMKERQKEEKFNENGLQLQLEMEEI